MGGREHMCIYIDVCMYMYGGMCGVDHGRGREHIYICVDFMGSYSILGLTDVDMESQWFLVRKLILRW